MPKIELPCLAGTNHESRRSRSLDTTSELQFVQFASCHRATRAAVSAPGRLPPPPLARITDRRARPTLLLHALILEDDPATRATLVELVAKEGFETLECGALADAHAALEQHRVGLAILDLELPDGSAMELLESLHSAGVEVLVMTERGDVDTAVEALEMGVADFLVKPLRAPQLRKAVRDTRKTWTCAATSTRWGAKAQGRLASPAWWAPRRGCAPCSS